MNTFKLYWRLSYVPILNRFLFKDADAIYKAEIGNGILDTIRGATQRERAMMHFSYGRYIRNRYLLWHPKNPYTCKPLEREAEDAKPASPYHPDNYSWGVISRLLVQADKKIAPNSREYTIEAGLVCSAVLCEQDDSPEALSRLEKCVTTFISDERYDLLDGLFEDAGNMHVSPAKLKVLLNVVAGYESHISLKNYSRIAQVSARFGADRHNIED